MLELIFDKVISCIMRQLKYFELNMQVFLVQRTLNTKTLEQKSFLFSLFM